MTLKPIHAKPSFYAFYFEVIKEIGLKYGYNIVLHGSMTRDLDLIAIPWIEVIGDKKLMLVEIAETVGGFILDEFDEQRQKERIKFHGRECYVININRTIESKYDGMKTKFEHHQDPQCYIDISILPHIQQNSLSDLAISEGWYLKYVTGDTLNNKTMNAEEKVEHVLYTDKDLDAPNSIKDRNGEVVLSLCKICGKGEAELIQDCTGTKLNKNHTN